MFTFPYFTYLFLSPPNTGIILSSLLTIYVLSLYSCDSALPFVCIFLPLVWYISFSTWHSTFFLSLLCLTFFRIYVTLFPICFSFFPIYLSLSPLLMSFSLLILSHGPFSVKSGRTSPNSSSLTIAFFTSYFLWTTSTQTGHHIFVCLPQYLPRAVLNATNIL